jgi:hypothetical protein
MAVAEQQMPCVAAPTWSSPTSPWSPPASCTSRLVGAIVIIPSCGHKEESTYKGRQAST